MLDLCGINRKICGLEDVAKAKVDFPKFAKRGTLAWVEKAWPH